ncbi:MAG: PAS domain-containing sensor histidine kinase [Planctomycetes bacterium]|nr:PAS domain-containing sensor histidine kinase [Planctomycetota bacterium]
MTLVWFVYGLAFFVLGLVILIYPKKGSQFDLARHLWMVGLFGLIHGVNEWLDMFIDLGGPLPPEVLAWVRLFVLPVSFFFLVQFGITILSRDVKARYPLRMLPSLLMIGWLLILLADAPSARFRTADIWARYLLCVPGTFLTAWALYVQIPRFQAMGLRSIPRNLSVAGVTFLLYGVFAGLVVKKAGFFPAAMVNYEAFIGLTGVPVQVFRALCAVVAAWSLVRVLDVFRWETQEALRISELRCATIASAIPVFLFMMDRDMIVHFVQGKGLDRLGLQPEQVRGRHIADAWPGRKDLVEHCRRALSGQEFIATATLGDATFEICYSGLKDATGAVTNVVGVALDISARILAQAELDEYRRKMEKHAREAEVGMLSAAMAQQTVEPLTVANLVLEKTAADLAASGGPEGVQSGLHRSLSELAKARETLTRFMEIAHPDTAAGTQPVGLYQIARRTMSVFANDARRHKLEIAVKDLDAMPLMAVSPREVEQIFYHLIQRAVDAAKGAAQHRLVVRSLSGPGHIDLLFSDTCGAIPPGSTLDSLLMADQVIHSSGLGLAVVRNIVACHGGQVTVDVAEDATTTFRVRLPVQKS